MRNGLQKQVCEAISFCNCLKKSNCLKKYGEKRKPNFKKNNLRPQNTQPKKFFFKKGLIVFHMAKKVKTNFKVEDLFFWTSLPLCRPGWCFSPPAVLEN